MIVLGALMFWMQSWWRYWISKCRAMFRFNHGKIFGFAKLIFCQEMFYCWNTWEVLPASWCYNFLVFFRNSNGNKAVYLQQPIYKCINLLVNSHSTQIPGSLLLSWLLCKQQAQCNLNYICSYPISLTLSVLFNIFLQSPWGKGYAWVRVNHTQHHCHVGRYHFLDRRWLLFALDNKKIHTFTSIFHTCS